MNLKEDNSIKNEDKSLAVNIIYGYSIIITLIFIFGPFRLSLATTNTPIFVRIMAFTPALFSATAIFLTTQRKYVIAKYIIIVIPPFSALLISLIFKQYDLSNNVFLYVTPRLMTVMVFAAPIIFFGLRHIKHLIISSIIILVPFAFFDLIHNYFGVGLQTMSYDLSSYKFYLIFSIVFCLLLMGTLLFFQKTGLLYKMRLETANKNLTSEKEEILSLNEQLEFQSYLFNVLTLTSQIKSLPEILDEVLLLIIGSDLLSSNSKGAIYLTDENGSLILTAKNNVPELEARCNKITSGDCICGMALKNRKSYFSANVAKEVTPRHQYKDGLGFYIVPFLNDKKEVLGTINIFVDKNKEKDLNLLVHLEAIAFILSKKITDVKSKQLLKEKNFKIDAQKKKIDSTLGELNKSIDYASHLINSLIPNQNTIDSYFQDCSILYLPRDTVSGDFYFTHKHNDHLYFGVGDCTGHGIPGAILASMSIELVKSVIQNNSDEKPDVLLTKIRAVTSSRFDTNTFNERSDSMDAALCMYDKQSEKLFFSGGFISLIIVDIDGNIVEYKATKCPIGSYIIERDFELHQVNLNKGDTIYLASDGYIDQFGYEYIDGVKKNKPSKYKRKRFYQLIKEHHNSSSKIQTSVFEAEINKWRDGIEQIDDITIMIVKH